jgi:hypothetical protein
MTHPLVHPDSPVDTCMFPPIYPEAVVKTEKADAMLLDADIEPFDYLPAGCKLGGEESLNSVFGDADLINSIMTSLATEQHLALHQATPRQQALVQLPTLPVISSYPCLRKPGTFLNKDGRWIKGKPCRLGNCDKRAQSNGLCKGHGGGARCSVDGCSKSSQGGGLCRAHGGGKRCLHEGCEKGTQRNGFCYLHGGVRSCVVEGCERKDRGNGKCFAHGGGRRCQAPYCLTTIRKGTVCEKHVSHK